MVTFHNLGALLGRLAPRCTDPVPLVRRAAVDCIYTLLHIQLRYEGEAHTQPARQQGSTSISCGIVLSYSCQHLLAGCV